MKEYEKGEGREEGRERWRLREREREIGMKGELRRLKRGREWVQRERRKREECDTGKVNTC